MSQQSLTFLSQAANQLHKPPKQTGGTSVFHAGCVGTALTLKKDTTDHIDKLKQAKFDEEILYERDRPLRLIEYHYQTGKKQKQEYQRLGAFDLPPKPVGSIPGYSGWVPRKEAANVIGCTYKVGALTASELFADEQETTRARNANILKPNKELQTPDTLQRR